MCFKQIAVLITGIALFVAHRSGAAALPGVLLNLGRWLIITSTFTFIFALYKVLIDARDGDMSPSPNSISSNRESQRGTNIFGIWIGLNEIEFGASVQFSVRVSGLRGREVGLHA